MQASTPGPTDVSTPAHDSPYDDACATAVRAARRGAEVIRSDAGTFDALRSDASAVQERKGVNDFVTATDRAAQAAIVEVLEAETPGVDILAEEGAASDGLDDLSWEGERWIVDPIDGTTNFMHRLPPYAVSIALQDADGLRIGVVLDVSHDVLYTAVAGYGLQRNGRPDGVTQTEALEDAFLATGFPYRHFEHTEAYLDVLAYFIRHTQGLRRHGSASIDLARLACGRFDGFYETGLMPWDVAAGILLIREGGGRATTYDGRGGLAPVYDRQVCGSNDTALHDALLEGLASMIDVRL